MKQRSSSSTIRYYDEHAEKFISNTVGLDLSDLYKPFLDRVPKGGRILDAGCGSGRDSKAFMELGFEVVSIDLSDKMVEATSELTGQQALKMSFHEIGYAKEFDGVWACASLLHVPLIELPKVLGRLARALRPSGVLYMSFKEGRGERSKSGRMFSDIDEEKTRELVKNVEGIDLVSLWLTGDRRSEHSEQWVNCLASKVGTTV
jgi:2-polyprenyl-3-methyl-5-hydroxy-6-metoxy-1,4-benzoquinol methylase